MNQQINLYRASFHPPRSLLELPVLFHLTAAIVLGMIILYAWTLWQSRALNTDLNQMQTWLVERSQQLTSASSTGTVDDDMRLLQTQLEQLQRQRLNSDKTIRVLSKKRQADRFAISNFMEALSRKVPKGLWLTAFSIDGNRKDVMIHGQSWRPELIPLFINQLAEERALNGVHFRKLQIQGHHSAKKPMDFILYSTRTPNKGKAL